METSEMKKLLIANNYSQEQIQALESLNMLETIYNTVLQSTVLQEQATALQTKLDTVKTSKVSKILNNREIKELQVCKELSNLLNETFKTFIDIPTNLTYINENNNEEMKINFDNLRFRFENNLINAFF
jgi:hypothetical protein